MVQLHELTIVLVVPLFVAILFAPKTIRLRDIVFGVISLLIIYAPFLVWQITAHFADIQLILHSTNVHPVIDSRAVTFYKRFLNSYYYDDEFLRGSFYDLTGSGLSVVFKILPVLVLMRYVLELCLLAGFMYAAWRVFRPQGKVNQDEAMKGPLKKPAVRFFSGLGRWWVRLRGDPQACGLLLLLLWQVVPVLALTRHGLQIHLHYLLMIVPGPFIFIGIVISRAISWLRWRQPARLWKKVSYATYALLVCILLIQLVGSSASLVDMTNGINNHIFGYNDIGSLEHAFQEADRVAQQHHLSRIYVTLSIKDDFDALLLGFPYLASQMHTPATLFESTSCLALPSPGEGSAVMLMRSSDTLTLALLNRFATATLVDEPPVLGSTPFKLYILTPRPFAQPVPGSATFAGQLQLIDSQVQQPGAGLPPRLISRWTLLQNEQPASRTTYNYIMSAMSDLPGAAPIQSACLLTSLRAGDQLVATFPLSQNDLAAHSFSVTAHFLVQSPCTITPGALHFETFKLQGKAVTLWSKDGSDTVTVTVLRWLPVRLNSGILRVSLRLLFQS